MAILYDPDNTFSVPIGGREPGAPKVGRNEPCSCGSGKKYKKCCLASESRVITRVPRELVEEVNRRSLEHEQRLGEHRARFGHVREAVHTTFKGRKVVAVGHRLYFDQPERRWRTFHDFLLEYARGLFGKGWAEAERCKPAEMQHPVMRMHDGVVAFMSKARAPNEQGLYEAVPNAPVSAFLALAYDLYVLRDNAGLQNRLIKRMRRMKQYQGARHELFAAATCLRAGFSLAFEDERDGSTKHPELLATDRETGIVIAVEAKSRHRPGVLGFGTGAGPAASTSAGMIGLFRDAMQKEPKYPFAIFLDVNLPAAPGGLESYPWVQEWERSTLPSLTNEERSKFNLVVCTNFPHHYAVDDSAEPPRTVLAHVSHAPAFPVTREVLERVAQAATLFGNVPPEFPATQDAAG